LTLVDVERPPEEALEALAMVEARHTAESLDPLMTDPDPILEEGEESITHPSDAVDDGKEDSRGGPNWVHSGTSESFAGEEEGESKPSSVKAEASDERWRPIPMDGVSSRWIDASKHLRNQSLLAMLILAAAFFVPVGGPAGLESPWSVFLEMQGPGFHAVLFIALLSIASVMGLSLAARALAVVGVGAGILVFGALGMREAAIRLVFHGHPLIHGIFADSSTATFLSMGAAMLLPAGLIVWARQERSMTGRTLVALGLGLSALLFWGFKSGRLALNPPRLPR